MPTDRKNHIFVDYENGSKIDLELVAGKPVHVTIVTGKGQPNFPKALAQQFITFSDQVNVVDNEHTGANAADFVLAVEIGRRITSDPKGFYHIVSRDKGLDAIVKHLKSQKILAARIEDFASVPILVPTERLTISQLADSYAIRLIRAKVGRPARKTSLVSQIGVHFQRRIDQKKCEVIALALVKRGALQISDEGKVTYPEPLTASA